MKKTNRILTKDFLIEKYKRNKLTLKEISKLTKFSISTIRNRLKKYDIKKPSLAETHPELCKQWSPKNKFGPETVSAGSSKRAVWVDEFGHEWTSTIDNRTTGGCNCPYCSGKKVLKGFNDLVTTHPEHASELHPTKNGHLKTDNINAGSNKSMWWLGKCGHEWQQTVYSKIHYDTICPICSGRKILIGYNDLQTKQPDLAKQWHPYKNGDKKPTDFTEFSNVKIWWIDEYGHEWQAIISHRSRGSNCPVCAGQKILIGFNDLASQRPDIATLWHPAKNGDLLPSQIAVRSNKRVWLQCEHGHEWDCVVNDITTYNTKCPVCNESSIERRTRVFLEELSILHSGQKTFDKCRNKNLLRFDFYLPDYNCCIECQGIQHFKYTKPFHKTKKDFQDLKKRDKIKLKFCKDNGIKLIYIIYDDKNIDKTITDALGINNDKSKCND